MTFRVISATLASAICFILGFFVYVRAPGRSMNRSFFAFNVGLSVWAIGDLLVTLAYTSERNSLALWFDRISYIGAIIVAPFFMLQLSSLVEKSAQGIHKIIKNIIYGGCYMLIILTLTPWVIKSVTLNPFEEHYGQLFTLVVAYFIGGLSYGIYHLWVAYKTSEGPLRNQIKYFAIAVFLGLLGAIVYFVSSIFPQFPPIYYYLEISYALVVAYAILAHHLMDITVIIRKTLIYAMVMTSLMAAYLSVITISAKIFEGLSGYQTIFSPTLAAALISFCFQPLRKRVQNFVDSKFFRQYVDREEKLYELSREVITHTTPEAMASALMRVLTESMHPKRAALYLRKTDGSGFGLIGSTGEAAFPPVMPEDNAMAKYFLNHPQPFVEDVEGASAESRSTRRLPHKERSVA